MPLKPHFQVTRSQIGIVERAEATIAGVAHEMLVKTGIANWRAYATAEFLENRACYLRLRCSMSVPEELATLSVDDGGKKSELLFDFSRYDTTHNVFVTGSSAGTKFSAVLDPRTNAHSGDDIAMERLLEQKTLARVQSMVPLFDDAKKIFDALRKPHEPTIQRTIHNSMWGSAGRAACWGFGALGGAAVCAGTFGAGCAAGVFIFAAAASACSDQ